MNGDVGPGGWRWAGVQLGQEWHLRIKGLEVPLKYALNLSPWMAAGSPPTSRAEPHLPLCSQGEVSHSPNKLEE